MPLPIGKFIMYNAQCCWCAMQNPTVKEMLRAKISIFFLLICLLEWNAEVRKPIYNHILILHGMHIILDDILGHKLLYFVNCMS